MLVLEIVQLNIIKILELKYLINYCSSSISKVLAQIKPLINDTVNKTYSINTNSRFENTAPLSG